MDHSHDRHAVKSYPPKHTQRIPPIPERITNALREAAFGSARPLLQRRSAVLRQPAARHRSIRNHGCGRRCPDGRCRPRPPHHLRCAAPLSWGSDLGQHRDGRVGNSGASNPLTVFPLESCPLLDADPPIAALAKGAAGLPRASRRKPCARPIPSFGVPGQVAPIRGVNPFTCRAHLHVVDEALFVEVSASPSSSKCRRAT